MQLPVTKCLEMCYYNVFVCVSKSISLQVMAVPKQYHARLGQIKVNLAATAQEVSLTVKIVKMYRAQLIMYSARSRIWGTETVY